MEYVVYGVCCTYTHAHQDQLYGSGSKKGRLFDSFCGWQIGIGSVSR
jgi:hypothetical protein